METANKKFRYSIRKFKVGVGSVLLATCLLGVGVSTPTAFAMADPSPATEDTEVKKTPLQHLKELVEELKMDLEKLKEYPEYDSTQYPLQKQLWDYNLGYGKRQMAHVSTLEESSPGLQGVLEGLTDFGNHIRMERLTREVDQYRKKYPNNERIEEEYKDHLEQTESKTYASQSWADLRASTDAAERAVERVKEIVKELEPKEEPAPKAEEDTPAPEAPTPKEDAPKAEEEAPKVEEETEAPKTEEKAPETKEETPKSESEVPQTDPAPKAEESAPTPAPKAEEDTPAPKVEEEIQEPKTEETTPEMKEETPAPVPETPMDEPKMEEPKAEMPEAKQPEMEHPKAEDSTPKTAVPEVAPKTAEKPKLDFTTKERKVEEALPIKEEIRYDASLALGKSYLLQEGKAGKKVSVYQDVIVDGKVVATNLLSETVVEGQNRILVKGSLEMKKEEVKTTPSVQSNPTMSQKGAPSANKATLPATGEQRNNLALVGLGLAGISLAVVATAITKKSKDQI
ncbi:TPA: GAG-binding domain-containing protein [Streptococcus suis]